MMTALIVTGLLATAQPPAERPNEPPDLTDAQQSALEQLRKERDRKTSQTWMGTALRIAGLVNSARIQSDRPVAETGLAVAHEVTGSLLAAQKARSDYHEKLRTLLTDEQRRQLAAAQAAPAPRPVSRRAARAGEILSLTSPDVQARLRLAADQVRKIDEIRAEMDARLRAVLTDEQRQRFDELTPRRRPRGPD